jgi:hypothetical protein
VWVETVHFDQFVRDQRRQLETFVTKVAAQRDRVSNNNWTSDRPESLREIARTQSRFTRDVGEFNFLWVNGRLVKVCGVEFHESNHSIAIGGIRTLADRDYHEELRSISPGDYLFAHQTEWARARGCTKFWLTFTTDHNWLWARFARGNRSVMGYRVGNILQSMTPLPGTQMVRSVPQSILELVL